MKGPGTWWFYVLGLGSAAAVGVGIILNPAITVGLVSGTAGILVLHAIPARLQHLYVLAQAALLIGYAFLGRGFAYLGIPPLYVGELVLALGLLTLLIRSGFRPIRRSLLIWLLLVFALHGVSRLIPYIGTYGLDAVRDGVIWGYGAFALSVSAIVIRSNWAARVPEQYGKWLRLFLFWIPIALLIRALMPELVPQISNGMPIVHLKYGDTAVHLAGAACFLMLGIAQKSATQRRGALLQLSDWMLWLAWLIGVLIVASTNRGGMLALLVAMTIVLTFHPFGKPLKTVVALSLTITIASALFVGLAGDIDLGAARKISPQQIIANLESVIGVRDERYLEGSRSWRLEWWGKIIRYTVLGEYFWTGKGYGINLADDDGFQVYADHSLRSPHNGHLTILARSGVPGFLLWTMLQGAFAVSMLRAYYRARRSNNDWWARLNLWILAYWSAFMINAAFDVYLEGPQGGIWFWSLFGFGIAVLEAQRQHVQSIPTAEGSQAARR